MSGLHVACLHDIIIIKMAKGASMACSGEPCLCMYKLMRDEKEGRKKQARSNKQQQAKQHSTPKAVTFPYTLYMYKCLQSDAYMYNYTRTLLHTRGGKIAFCILSNTCVGLGINTISLLEIRGEGVQWSNLAEPISLDDNFHLGYVLMMLILDSIVYMLIAW